MKTITVQTLCSTIESILKEQEKLSQMQGQKFIGISEFNLITELDNKLGREWALKSDSPIKFTKQDIAAVANSRFIRGTGSRILMQLAIAILGLALLYQFRVLPYLIYISLCGVVAFGFFWYFTKKQAEAKKSFWKGIDGVDDGK